MLQLHYHPSDASIAPHMLLEEIGAPFELKFVDRSVNAQKSAAYLKLNPNGLIPVLVDGDLVLYETAAILLHLADTHLADTHSAAALAPAFGSAERAHYYKWMLWLANSLHASVVPFFYPQRWADDAGAVAQVKAHAETRSGQLLDQLDAQLAHHGGPWLLGAAYSAVDPYALMLCCWTRHFVRPARALPQLGAYLQRVQARPAVQRALRTEGLPQDWG
jgi:glutathione S-transferase